MCTDIKIGYSEGNDVVITKDEQLKHLFIYGGSSQTQLNNILLETIKSKVTNGDAVIVIQGKANQFKDILINRLQDWGESNKFFEVKASDEFQVKDTVCDILFKKINQGCLVYVNFDGENKSIYTRVFMSALSAAFDKLRNANFGRSRQHACIVSTNIEQIGSQHWLKVINFARSLNIMVVSSVGSFSDQEQLRGESDLMYRVVDELFEASAIQILLKQSSHDESLELSRHIGIQTLSLQKKAIARLNTRNTKVLLNQITNKQLVMLDINGVSIVNT